MSKTTKGNQIEGDGKEEKCLFVFGKSDKFIVVNATGTHGHCVISGIVLISLDRSLHLMNRMSAFDPRIV